MALLRVSTTRLTVCVCELARPSLMQYNWLTPLLWLTGTECEADQTVECVCAFRLVIIFLLLFEVVNYFKYNYNHSLFHYYIII